MVWGGKLLLGVVVGPSQFWPEGDLGFFLVGDVCVSSNAHLTLYLMMKGAGGYSL